MHKATSMLSMVTKHDPFKLPAVAHLVSHLQGNHNDVVEQSDLGMPATTVASTIKGEHEQLQLHQQFQG